MGFFQRALEIYVGFLLGGLSGFIVYSSASLAVHPEIDMLSVTTAANLAEVYSAFIEVTLSGGFYEFFSIILGGLLGITVAVGFQRAAVYLATVMFGALSGMTIYVLGSIVTNYSFISPGGYVAYAIKTAYSFTPPEVTAMLVGAGIGLAVARNLWKFTGVMTYVALVTIIMGYLVYSYTVTLPKVPIGQREISYALIFAETASLLMVLIYAFYSLDMHMKSKWRRLPSEMHFSTYYIPKIAFHVPIFNEPPAIVKGTLSALKRIDYPKNRCAIMVIDDSTEKSLSKPVRDFCKKHGIQYLTRKTRRGYKAGALNYALKKTSDDTDLIAVIDADYQVERNYPKDLVGYFINPNLAFIQTPQDYRNKNENFLTEQYYYADSYFYRAVMPARNEANAIIFAGTMGIIRKDVLEEVGGWGEKFVCEDAELSVRLLDADYDSLYVNRTFGRGLVPSTFEGYKKQLYRWSFGGVKILKAHFFRLMFSPRLSIRQKFDFFVGGLHWFDGVYIVMIAAIIALFASGDIAGLPIMTYHQQELWLIGLVPLFLIIDGVARLNMALRRTMGLSIPTTFRVMGMWFSIKFNNMFAALKSLAGFSSAFVRTPKDETSTLSRSEKLRNAIRLTKFETLFGALLLALTLLVSLKTALLYYLLGSFTYTRLLLIAWLLFYAMIFLSGPVYAYRSYSRSIYEKKNVSR